MATTEKGIYYPNDYSSVADVPTDMKKMAESIDNAIGNIPQYDDTKIKQDIKNLQKKDEAQDESIAEITEANAKQDDLIQKLKDNCINVTTEESTSLQVQDASTLPAKLEVRGNHSQETREGYNLLKITKENQSYYGVTMTINKDKSVSFNGTSTSTTGGFALVGNTEFSVDDFPYGEQLTFSCKGLVDGVELAIAESDINGSWLRNLVVLNSSSPTKQATISKGENASYIRAAYTVTTGKTFSNVITYPMIYKGTEGKPFEAYGASPSLDYPSEVRAVGDNVNIFKDEIYNNFVVNNSAKKEVIGKEIKVTTSAISNSRNIFR